MSHTPHQLKLNRKLQHHTFSSWRLAEDNHAAIARSEMPLPELVLVPAEAGPQDFLHVREALLHNSLVRSNGHLFVGLQGPQGFSIHQVLTQTGEQEPQVQLQHITGPLPVPTPTKDSQSALSYSAAAVQVASPAEGESMEPGLLLFSSGHGDLRVCVLGQGSTASEPVYPFPSGPSDSPQPFILEAAYSAAGTGGVIRTLAWLISPRPGSKHAVCEMYALTLALTPNPTETGASVLLTLEVLGKHLVQSSHLPPHGAVVDPLRDTLLLAVDPTGANDDVPKGPQPGAAGAVDDDEEEGDVDPRNLEQAAARLDKFTTQHAAGQDCQPAWNVDGQDGGDPETEAGVEPSCELLQLDFGPDHRQAPSRVWSMTCGAHKLLAAAERGSGGILLGVSDDVDCALVRMAVQAGEQEPVVLHEGFVPALAYVITGKVQRRHVLIGGTQQVVAAAVVESQKYCYLYKQVDRREEYGVQLVVDMQLPDGEAVLGAQLAGGQQAGQECLLLLTKSKLLVLRLV